MVAPMAQPDTRLGGRWLTLARLAWITLVAAGLALFLISIPVRYQLLHTLSGPTGLPWGGTPEAFRADLAQLGLSVGFYATYQVAVEVIFALAFCSIPLIIFWLKSDDWLAMIVSFGLVMFGITGSTPIILAGLASQRGWLWLIEFAEFLNVLGSVVTLQTAFRALTGQTSQLAVVAPP